MIVKCGDDLRQELLAYQYLSLLHRLPSLQSALLVNYNIISSFLVCGGKRGFLSTSDRTSEYFSTLKTKYVFTASENNSSLLFKEGKFSSLN